MPIQVETEQHLFAGETQTLAAIRMVEREPPLTGITPQQAVVQIDELQKNAAFMDSQHPDHAAVVAKLTRLYTVKGGDDDRPAEPTIEEQRATLSEADVDNIERATVALGGEEGAASIEAIAASNFDMLSELTVLGQFDKDHPGTADAIREHANLSAAEAKRAIDEKMMDETFQKPYLDNGHPGHNRAVGTIIALRFIATGGLDKWKQALAQQQPQS